METSHRTPKKQVCENDYKTPRKSARRSQTPSLGKYSTTSEKKTAHSPEKQRRSGRKISPSKRYNDNEYEIKTRKKSTICYKEDSDENKNEFEFFECDSMSGCEPVELFNEAIDVPGKKLYGFSTPKKKDALLKVVNNTPKTPKTPNSNSAYKIDPKRSRQLDIQMKTPSRVRNKVKKEIAKQIQESSEDDSSDDDSEYSPSEDEESDSSNENEQGNIISSDEEINESGGEIEDAKIKHKNLKRQISIPILPKTPGKRKSNRILAKEYIPESEEYFTAHANKKIVTSDHTLDRLKNPRLAPDHLFSILSSMTISKSHEKAVANLLKEYQYSFSKWMFMLNEGFNIICYGLGSKRRLLLSFHKEMLADQNVIVINGFFPSLTLKDILDGVIADILNIPVSPGNPHEAVNLIEEKFNELPQNHLFLIIHNLDGPMLRNSKAQEILSRLAKISNFHLIASIDHINAPLLWDSIKLSNYNFIWWDTTTMLPYTDETAFENSLMVQNSGELALSSMRSVFLSLTTNSRGIYMLIVNHQLRHGKAANYQGMSFKDLYYACREAFLVSSDLALRAQLTEFLDHKLVRNKRSVDGTEFLQIPINSDLLQQFLNEHEQSG